MRCATNTAKRRLAGGDEKRNCKEIIAAEIRSEIDALVSAPVGRWDFDAIELAARRQALRIAGLAVARHP